VSADRVVMVTAEDGAYGPWLHGPYTDRVAQREAKRLRAHLDQRGFSTPVRVTVITLERGPIRVTVYST
jgi:hypothetical protein